jgi:hypothetical protein
LPLAVEPLILITPVPQLFVRLEPAATDTAPQEITLVEVGFVPAQIPLPVTVSVAVNDPEEVDGVKTAKAGFAFCVQEPEPPPPDQVTAE